MKALILNSGNGKRMGDMTKNCPKCLIKLCDNNTILEKQLTILNKCGITDVIITTGRFDEKIRNACKKFDKMNFIFVKNNLFDSTNYIYSMYLAKPFLDDDILLLHGDLVFEEYIILRLINADDSSVIVDSTLEIPEKDFKASIKQGKIEKIGVEYYNNVVPSQPIYKMLKKDMDKWSAKISEYCEANNISCYAENALNDVMSTIDIVPIDANGVLCMEIDDSKDLEVVNRKIETISNRKIYLSLSSDVIHYGHINIIQYAASLGELTVGILSDEAIASYKHYPILSFNEKKKIISKIVGVSHIVEQTTLSYKKIIEEIRPDIIVHGDDWIQGVQSPIRSETIELLKQYGSSLIEPPCTKSENCLILENKIKEQLTIPENRCASLRKLLKIKKCIRVMEAHNGLTGLIVEKTYIPQNGEIRQFDAMWVSSLCDSTSKGKPDIELVDMTSRLNTINEIMEVTTKPIILDGDTGGLLEHFVFYVKTLERIGVSAVIIEDKIGLKKNSLFGTEVMQMQDDPDNFAMKITAGKKAQCSKNFMIIARIESLILEKGMDDALSRAKKYVDAGADGIMIHSRKKTPDEIFEFTHKFRLFDAITPIIIVPTSYNQITEEEFEQHGINIIIYANHLIRSAFPAMQEVSKTILENHRSKEVDDKCLSIKEIINLIPDQ